jgi:hypothetical protein
MTSPHSKADLIEQLRTVQSNLAQTVQGMTDEQFETGTETTWSACGYLKHLILSIKPFAKAIALPKDRLLAMFNAPNRPSITYDELVAMYKARLNEGIKAENYEAVTPVYYRFPDGVEDIKGFLVEVWSESNNRLMNALEAWSEEDLDTHQIPHPAIGLLTIREMLFFTLHHNTLHWHDIQAAGSAVQTQES